MCEEKQSAEMLRLGGGFWDGGLEAVDKGMSRIDGDDREGSVGAEQYDEEEEEEWEREAVAALESLGSINVLDG
jgi:nuclear pore complex protein Nup107